MQAKLKLVFSEESRPLLLDISSLLYDFELLHDFSLILCAEDYSNYTFSRLFWFRNGRPIITDHRVRVARIVKESPLIIELVLAGISVGSGALWVLLQATEKIQNWRLSREKLKLEVEKLRMEKEKLKLELEQKIQQREAIHFFNSLITRLERLPMKLVDMEITLEGDDTHEKIIFG